MANKSNYIKAVSGGKKKKKKTRYTIQKLDTNVIFGFGRLKSNCSKLN